MSSLTSSLSYRAAHSSSLWLATAARHSLVGRFLLVLARVLGRVFADSRVFGTRYTDSSRLAWKGHPWSLLVLARPYLWCRRVVGEGALGRAARAGEEQIAHSRFSGGAWVVVAGAGLMALGFGRLALLATRGITTVDHTELALDMPELRLVTPIVVIAIGALMLLCGPRLVAAFASSSVGRGIGLVSGEPVTFGSNWRRHDTWTDAVIVTVAAVLACAAGMLAGITVGSTPLVLFTGLVALCVLGLILARPEALLLAFAAFPWLDWGARSVLGGLGPGWDDALLLFSVCLLLWCVMALRRWELWTVPITLPTILAFAAALGSIVIRDVPGDVALFALRILFQPLLFYFLGFLFPKDKAWVRRVTAVFILTGVALALHGLYQYATHAPMPASWVDVREASIGTRAYSIVQNPNGLGAFLVMGTLVSLSLALRRGIRGVSRVVWAVTCVVNAAGVAVTFSRGAWIGLGVGLIAVLIMAYRRYLVPLIGVGVVGWFAAPSMFVDRLTFAFSSAYLTKSATAGRLYVWKTALEYMGAHPWFGLGLGTFGGTCAVTFSYGRLWVDNFYLQLGAEGGLLLLVFFLWILLRGAKGLVRGYVTTQDPYTRALTAGAFGAFIAVVVANLTASVWETLIVGVGFWFLTGFATSAALHETAMVGDAQGEPASDGEAS